MVYNPEIDINVQSALSLIPQEGETVITLIGTAQYGPMDSVVTTTSFNSVLNTFKEDKNDNTTITKAAELAYANGASVVKVVRISDSDSEYASLDLDGNSGVTTDVITFKAKYKGTYGNNFMIDVDDQGTGRIVRVKVGDTIELFDNNGATNGYADNDAIASAINDSNNGSKYVTCTVNNNSEIVDATANYTQLTSGDDGADSLASSDYTTAFDDLLVNEDWDILIIPNSSQSSSIEDTDAFHTTMLAKIETRASTYKKYGIYVTGVSKDETISTIQARTTRGSRFVLCSPSIEHVSRVDGSTEYLDGTYLGCSLAGLMAGFDNVAVSPTRKTISVDDLLVNESSGKKYYNNIEIDQLLSSGVVAVSNINNNFKVSRGVTRISDTTSIYFEINIVRIIDNIKDIIRNGLDDYLGEPNSEFTRSRMRAYSNGVLQNQKEEGILNEYLPVSVTEGSSPDTVDVSMTIRPAFATNFINVTITVNNI
jgi:hypothetical protein